MVRLGRPGSLSNAQKRQIWDRWRRGQSLSDIGRVLGKAPGSVYNFVATNGGVVPAQRKRSSSALRLAEREEISRGLAAGESLRMIAARLGRAASTISQGLFVFRFCLVCW